MIINQIKGTSHIDLLKYQYDKVNENKAKLIGGNMLGNDAQSLAREFEISNKQRPSLKTNVYHVSISTAPGENLTDNQFNAIAIAYLHGMNFNNNQFMIFRHYDTDIQHIHIVSSRIKLNGDVVSDSWDYRRAENLARKFEKEYNLRQVQNSNKSNQKALSKGMIENFKRTGKVPVKVQLQQIINNTLDQSSNIYDFINNIYNSGATINFHNNNYRIFGVSYELDGITFKASQLGKSFSWINLKNQYNYDQRNHKSIIEANGRRKKAHSRPASRTTASNQFKEHRAINLLLNANSGINQQINSGSSKRSYHSSGAASQFYGNYQQSNKEHAASGNSFEGNERYSLQFEKDNTSGSYNTRNIEQSIEFLTNILQVPKIIHPIGPSYHLSEEELERSRKKKKRRLSNNDFYR